MHEIVQRKNGDPGSCESQERVRRGERLSRWSNPRVKWFKESPSRLCVEGTFTRNGGLRRWSTPRSPPAWSERVVKWSNPRALITNYDGKVTSALASAERESYTLRWYGKGSEWKEAMKAKLGAPKTGGSSRDQRQNISGKEDECIWAEKGGGWSFNFNRDCRTNEWTDLWKVFYFFISDKTVKGANEKERVWYRGNIREDQEVTLLLLCRWPTFFQTENRVLR